MKYNLEEADKASLAANQRIMDGDFSESAVSELARTMYEYQRALGLEVTREEVLCKAYYMAHSVQFVSDFPAEHQREALRTAMAGFRSGAVQAFSDYFDRPSKKSEKEIIKSIQRCARMRGERMTYGEAKRRVRRARQMQGND